MKYAIIGDEDTIIGFGILGVPGKIATNADEAQRAFQAILDDKDKWLHAEEIRRRLNKMIKIKKKELREQEEYE